MFYLKDTIMESNDIIQPMTGKKVCYNIGHDDLVASRSGQQGNTSCPYAWAVRQCFVSLMSVRSSTSDDLETVLMTRACEKKGEFF